MRLPFSLSMALKYLKPKKSLVSIVTLISMVGVALGVAVLIIVLSVMTGFDEVWRDRILKFNAHVNLLPRTGLVESWESLCEEALSLEEVVGAAPMIDGLVLTQTESRMHTPILRGVDIEREKSVSEVPDSIIDGEFSLDYGEIVIGNGVARRMNLHVGDVVNVVAPQGLLLESGIQLPEELRVSGIFYVGMFEFDEGYVYTSLSTASSLFDIEQGANSVKLMLNNPMEAKLVADKLRSTFNDKIYPQTWMQAHQQIFTALQVEKNMMFFLLAFVALVAAFSITNTLITLTVQKTREIGLLKALGFRNSGIMGIFVWMGLLQGIIGTVSGIGLAYLALYYRNDILRFMSNEWHLDLLPPELYQLSQLPAKTSITDVGLVAGLVLLFCMLAGMLPAWRAARMEPVDALRFE